MSFNVIRCSLKRVSQTILALWEPDVSNLRTPSRPRPRRVQSEQAMNEIDGAQWFGASSSASGTQSVRVQESWSSPHDRDLPSQMHLWMNVCARLHTDYDLILRKRPTAHVLWPGASGQQLGGHERFQQVL